MLTGAVLGLVSLPAAAQVPTAEQLKLLQSLPADQREALMQQFGQGGAGAAQGNMSRLPTAARPQSNTVFVKQPAPTESEDNPNQPKRAKAGDTLLIEIVLRDPSQVPPPKLPSGTTLNAPGQQQGGVNPNQATVQPRPTQTQAQQNPYGADANQDSATSGVEPARRRTPQELVALRDRLLSHNPYELDDAASLLLPGFAPIRVAGLTAEEIEERLAIDPILRSFEIGVTLLRVTAQGNRALKPFGYEIFRNSPNAFVPGTDIPVPADYVLGSGDVVQLDMYGQKTVSYNLTVTRDGTITVPELGPVSVGGMSFAAATAAIQGRVRQQLIGMQAHVTLGDLRSARVLVLGDAEHPGTYVVSGMATVTSALFAAAGVKEIGSLRDIQVRRGGQLVRHLDLYEVLLHGNTGDDVRLQPGDAIFVPPVGHTAGIDGQVRRPAIYELKSEGAAGELVELAGGLSPEADARRVTVERVEASQRRSVLTIDLTTPAGRQFKLVSGDVLRVPSVRPTLENAVAVEGYVYKPGSYQYRDGMRISEVIPSVDELKPHADIHYLLIRRESPSTRRITILSADLQAALDRPGSEADLVLQPRDRIQVFDLDANRDNVVDPLMMELRRQGTPGALASVVTVNGSVKVPGRYPLEAGMHVSDLLRAGGGLQDAAYANAAELTRYGVGGGEQRSAELRQIDLSAILRGDPAADVALQPYDVLHVKEMPEWRRVEEVDIAGEVRFPGRYQIRRGETIHSLVERAGGLSPLAFADGAVFTREELKVKERQQLDRLATRLQSELAALSLQASQTNPQATQAVGVGQSLLDQLRDAKPVGRLVIDLGRIVAGGKSALHSDVTLRNGDRLVVPRQNEEVSVLGEVQNPTSHLYQPGFKRDDYVAMSGGVSRRADTAHIYVVGANGSVGAVTGGWLHPSRGGGIKPGDTVIVPLDAEQMRPLTLWTQVTTIIYNLAVATAAVARF